MTSTIPSPLVLVAEDDVVIARLFARVLEADGFRVHLVVDGREALQWLAAERPDVILLDIEMPHVDGRDVLSRLRDDERLFDVPVFVISGRDDDYTRENVIRLGARDLIGKPVDPEAILRRVRRVLST